MRKAVSSRKADGAASKQKTLGIKTRVVTEARVRSGCSKSTTTSCGIGYRGG
jgi:hypothetical protein